MINCSTTISSEINVIPVQPCRSCGQLPFMSNYNEEGAWHVCCLNKDCMAYENYEAVSTNKAEAITMWNKHNQAMTDEDARAQKFLDVMSPIIPSFLNGSIVVKLKEMGFFTAPASIHHHGAYTGALYDHSLEVTHALLYLTEKLDLKWRRKCSPYIVGMFHDLCKVDNYCNKGDDCWDYNNATLLPGHGEKSVIMLQQIIDPIRLNEEELLCIRWHMGAFDDKQNWNSYAHAVEKYPNVLYTHTADMIAAHIKQI